MAQVEETAAFDSKDSFALRVKYDKHVLFIPVEPSTSYETLVGRALGMLGNSDASPPEDSSFTAFDDMQPDDVALFSGSTGVAGGVAAHDATIRFVELDRASQSTVAKMGLHDGAEAVVYLGFRSKVKDGYDNPIVCIPALLEDEDDEDPDAIPPPLDDEDDDDVMADSGKGKERA